MPEAKEKGYLKNSKYKPGRSNHIHTDSMIYLPERDFNSQENRNLMRKKWFPSKRNKKTSLIEFRENNLAPVIASVII
jgi:hypothetical protein